MTTENLDSDHGRWRLYGEAINRGVGSELLLRAVALEVDRSLAVSIVLRMLELVPEDQYSAWIDQLAPDNRTYSLKRAAEIHLLRRARSGGLDLQEVAGSLDSWSDWLQLRLATSVDDARVLSIVSARGRTKRIRNAADERIRKLMK
jgi:hypothetical protein